MEQSIIGRVEEEPLSLGVPAYDRDHRQLPDPETVDVPEQMQPNFSETLGTWELETAQYGNVAYEVFASNDGTLFYTFCQDPMGRAWISAVEVNSELEPTGLRRQWVDAGALTTPAYEYAGHDDRYANTLLQSGQYYDMFTNYLIRVPMIRRFLGRNESARLAA